MFCIMFYIYYNVILWLFPTLLVSMCQDAQNPWTKAISLQSPSQQVIGDDDSAPVRSSFGQIWVCFLNVWESISQSFNGPNHAEHFRVHFQYNNTIESKFHLWHVPAASDVHRIDAYWSYGKFCWEAVSQSVFSKRTFPKSPVRNPSDCKWRQ